MLTTNTSVLARRVRIASDYATLPYEGGWASEAVFFVQTEGPHPELRVIADVSPDGIHWIPRGSGVVMSERAELVEVPLTTFGTWLRLRVEGASEEQSARILVHVNLKG